MAKRGTKAGDFYVEGHVDTSGLKEGMDDAKKTVQQDTEQMGGGFKRVGERIEKSTEGIRKLQGAISATAGIVTGLVGSFTLLVGFARAYSQRWQEALKAKQEALVTTARMREEMDLQLAIARGATEEEVLRRRVALDLVRTQDRIADLAREGKLEAAEAQQLRRDADELAQLEIKRGLEGIRQRRAEEAKAAQESIADVDKLQFRNERMLADLRARRQQDAEEEEAEAQKRAERMADSMAKAFRNALTGSSFNQDIAGPIEEMTRRIETKLDQLKHGGRF